MKCMSCGNLIPDASTVCPYCNASLGPVVAPVAPEVPAATPVQTAPVAPVAPVAPEVMVNPTPVIPITPVDAPVAPAAPVMETPVAPVAPVVETPAAPVAPAPVAMETPVVNPVVMETPVAPAAPVMPEVAVAPVAPSTVVPETPVAPVLPQDQGMVSAPVAPVMETPAAPVAPVDAPIMAQPAPTTSMVAQGVLPDAAFGVREASTAEPTKKKMGKGGIIAIIVLLVILIAGGVGGYLYYSSQYKSADKRLDVIVNTLFKDLVAIKNEKIELASGKYSVEAGISADENNMSAKVSGTYAYDIPNSKSDFTIDIKSLNVGQELLDEGELNLEIYSKDSKIYLLLQNFYDKYIYADLSEYLEDLEIEEEPEIEMDYNKVIVAVREATKAGLRAASKTQTVDNVTIGGKSQKANIVTIQFTEANGEKMGKAFITALANNKNFVSEMARVSGEKEEDIKQGLLDTLKEDNTDVDYEEEESDLIASESYKLEIYTAMFGEEFLGAKLNMEMKYNKKSENYLEGIHKDQSMILNVYPDGKKIIADMTYNNEKLFDLSYESSYEKTSVEEKNTVDFKFTVKNEDSAVTITLKTMISSDLQPKVPDVVTKDSISYDVLTEADIEAIYNKIKDYGTFGMLIESTLSSYLEPTPDYDDYYEDDYDFDYEDDYYYDSDLYMNEDEGNLTIE